MCCQERCVSLILERTEREKHEKLLSELTGRFVRFTTVQLSRMIEVASC
jgi:hypothetical protein